MLFRTLDSSKLSERFAEAAMLTLAVFIFLKPAIALVPILAILATALFVIPFAALLSLVKVDWSVAFRVAVVITAAATEFWCYCLYQAAYFLQFGAPFSIFPN